MNAPAPREPLPLPHNDEIEQGLLAAILTRNEIYFDIADAITADHFFVPAHQSIYAALRDAIEAGKEATGFTLKNHFDNDPLLRDLGGARYVAKLMQSPVLVKTAMTYAVALRDLYMRRQLVMIAESLLDRTVQVDLNCPAEKLLEDVESEFFRLASTVSPANARGYVIGDFKHQYFDRIQEAIAAGGALVGLPTNVHDLDDAIGGLHRSDLTIVGGRPGTGKTALACTMTRAAATEEMRRAEAQGRKPGAVAFFSLEMSKEQLFARMIAAETGITVDRQRRGQVSNDDILAMQDATARLESLPIVWFDRGRVSSAYIRRNARRVKRQRGLSLIVVDHLQLMEQTKRFERRQLEIADACHDLKNTAKELEVPIVLLCQLSRASEQQVRRPIKADLRECGDIEQDADEILLLFREEMYLKKPIASDYPDDASLSRADARYYTDLTRCRNIIEIIIDKNRHGPIKTAKAFFDGDRQTVESLDQHHV